MGEPGIAISGAEHGGMRAWTETILLARATPPLHCLLHMWRVHSCGLCPQTLLQWLKIPEFVQEYRKARRDLGQASELGDAKAS